MAFSMSGDVNRDVTITFIGKDNASAAMRNISGTAQKTTTIASRLATTLKYVGLAAATALAAGALLAAKAIYDVTKAAYYDDIAMKKLAYTQMKAQDATKAQADATSDLIDKLELATGVADDELRPAMAALAATGMEVKKSQDLLSLALDISVARGKSVQTVAEALAKAYNGQITGLTRLGIKTTDASGEALELSEVIDQLKDKFEGAAKAAGRTDPIKRLGAAWSQVKEELGRGFLPILKDVARYIIDNVVPWVKKDLIPAVKAFTRWVREDAIPWLKGLWDALKDLRGEWDKTSKSVSDFKEDLDGLMGSKGADPKSYAAITFVLQQLGAWVRRITSLLNGWVTVFDAVHDAGVAAGNAIQYVIDKLTNLPTPPSWLTNPIGSAVDRAVGVIRGQADGGWLGRASGGWTMVGEHGPELISNRGFVKPHSATMGAGGGDTVIYVQGAIDPVGTARQIERILAKGGRATGFGQLATA